MMWRARRLKQIAEANQPVFDSTTGAHWWLAEAPSKNDPPKSVAPAPTAAPAESKTDEYFIAMSSTIGSGSSPVASVDQKKETESAWSSFQRPAAPIARADSNEERLTWDAKSCCFVACM